MYNPPRLIAQESFKKIKTLNEGEKMKVAQNVQELIGKTPLVRLNFASKESGANVIGKCEFMNPSGSVKDRIALGMINAAIGAGKITPETIVIEPTSGNTGIGLASVCAAKGIKLILTMPSSMSIERRKLLAALGAQIELTPAEKGMKGAVERALELAQETKNSFVPQQFENPANPEYHRVTTAVEIWEDLDGKVDVLVAGVGTGGTITGVGEVLKAKNPNLKIYAVEPIDSPVLSGGKPGPHKIQGIGAGFVPKALNTALYDEVIQVKVSDAYEMSRRLGKEEGILVGISAGANIWASKEIGKKYPGKTVVTILCDTGERYLSTELFDLQPS
ncbi:CYSTEINE SYNTHASE/CYSTATHIONINE BETA-SYNTHASE [Wolinella succinogenes]|uniref:Cysteine synthase n=2 Tax=Wolinella succinogenes TaxID=844 RepID=Q7M958_WOLSU|nr:CYSTEINE SYNTHASE/CYSTATHIONINE BETA-SYNTHASE [Wolinella succinogenes]